MSDSVCAYGSACMDFSLQSIAIKNTKSDPNISRWNAIISSHFVHDILFYVSSKFSAPFVWVALERWYLLMNRKCEKKKQKIIVSIFGHFVAIVQQFFVKSIITIGPQWYSCYRYHSKLESSDLSLSLSWMFNRNSMQYCNSMHNHIVTHSTMSKFV